jgi:hypothetical protein
LDDAAEDSYGQKVAYFFNQSVNQLIDLGSAKFYTDKARLQE